MATNPHLIQMSIECETYFYELKFMNSFSFLFFLNSLLCGTARRRGIEEG